MANEPALQEKRVTAELPPLLHGCRFPKKSNCYRLVVAEVFKQSFVLSTLDMCREPGGSARTTQADAWQGLLLRLHVGGLEEAARGP